MDQNTSRNQRDTKIAADVREHITNALAGISAMADNSARKELSSAATDLALRFIRITNTIEHTA